MHTVCVWEGPVVCIYSRPGANSQLIDSTTVSRPTFGTVKSPGTK